MVSVDGSVFIQIVNFLLLIWMLNMVLYKPIRGVLLDRKLRMSKLELDIGVYDKDAVKRNDVYFSGIKEARLAGKMKKNELTEEAVKRELEIVKKINEDSQIELNEVRKKILDEVSSVRFVLEREVDSFASAIGKKILGRVV